MISDTRFIDKQVFRNYNIRMKKVYEVCRLLVLVMSFWSAAGNSYAQWNPDYSIGTVTGNYNFNYNQTPAQLVEINSPVYTAGTGLTYQWEQSVTADFTPGTITVVGTQSAYTFSGPLGQ